MKVKSFLLLALLHQSIQGMDTSSIQNEDRGDSIASMIITSLQQVRLSDTTISRKKSIKASEMTLDDILAEPLTKEHVLKTEPWYKVTASQVVPIFEALCNPRIQMNYRHLRNDIAAALHAGVPPDHDFMVQNFSTAVAHDDICLVKLMLNKKVAGINTVICGTPPIFFASTSDMAKILMQYGARLDKKVGGKNLIHTVLHNRYDPELIYYYSEQGIDIEETDNNGLSSLDYFTQNKSSYSSTLATQYLVSFVYAGVPVDDPFIEKQFVDAIIQEDEDLIAFLLGNNVDPNAVVNNQHAIFYAPNIRIAKILRSSCADLHIRTEQGNLIHNVLRKKYDPRLISYYAKQGVSLEDTDNDGLTPFDYFCTHNYSNEEAEEYIEAFLDAGIDEQTLVKRLRTFLPTHWQDDFDEVATEDTASANTYTNDLLGLPHD